MTSRTRWNSATPSRSTASRCSIPQPLRRPSGASPKSCAPASMPVHRCPICRRSPSMSRVASGGAWPPMSLPARAILLAAWDDAVLVGTVMLEFASSPNQPHRAEVQKLLVHPDARRSWRGTRADGASGTWRRSRRQDAADARHRAGDAAEQLYRAMGWHEAGRIPGYALNADRTPCDTIFFWKTIDRPFAVLPLSC